MILTPWKTHIILIWLYVPTILNGLHKTVYIEGVMTHQIVAERDINSSDPSDRTSAWWDYSGLHFWAQSNYTSSSSNGKKNGGGAKSVSLSVRVWQILHILLFSEAWNSSKDEKILRHIGETPARRQTVKADLILTSAWEWSLVRR